MMKSYCFMIGNEAVTRTFRNLHAGGFFLSLLIRLRGCGVTGRLALPLHSDGHAAVLQVPTGHNNILSFFFQHLYIYIYPYYCYQLDSQWKALIKLPHTHTHSVQTSHQNKSHHLQLRFVPDNAIQTADLLVGVDSLILERQLLLERGTALLHDHVGLPAVERSSRIFWPHHGQALLCALCRREERGQFNTTIERLRSLTTSVSKKHKLPSVLSQACRKLLD